MYHLQMGDVNSFPFIVQNKILEHAKEVFEDRFHCWGKGTVRLLNFDPASAA
jgi:hypothetical protein